MLHTPFPTKPIQVDDARFISTQSLSFLDKSESKYPIKMDDRVFPYYKMIMILIMEENILDE